MMGVVIIIVAANKSIFCLKVLFITFACNQIANWGFTNMSDRENFVIIIQEGGFISKVGHIKHH